MNLIFYRKLYKLPHWVPNEKDLDILANKIAEQDDNTRASVKYLAAPGAGKTCAVLPAFLRCAERHGFTHYIYIAFNNNEKRTFRANPLHLVGIKLKPRVLHSL